MAARHGATDCRPVAAARRATTATSDDEEVDVETLLDEKTILQCVQAAWQRELLLIAAGILLCGLCGLRPQEVVELRRRDRGSRL